MDFSLDRCVLYVNGVELKLVSLGLVLTKEREDYYLLHSEKYNSYYLAVMYAKTLYKIHRIDKKKYDLFLNEASDVKFSEIVLKSYSISTLITIKAELHSDIPPITVSKFKVVNGESNINL